MSTQIKYLWPIGSQLYVPVNDGCMLHFESLTGSKNFKNGSIGRPVRRMPPKITNPKLKLPCWPRKPSMAGTNPWPIRVATGMIRDIATLWNFSLKALERAVKPAGKKHVATRGWIKTAITNNRPWESPKKAAEAPARYNQRCSKRCIAVALRSD